MVALVPTVDADEWREARPLMGTVVDVQLEGGARAQLRLAAQAAFAEMTRLAAMLSHYEPESVVTRINRDAGGLPVSAPRELIEVLQLARRVSQVSGGAFDITIGSITGWRFDAANAAAPDTEQLKRQLPLVNFRDVIVDEAAGSVFLAWPGMRIDLGGIAKLYILQAAMNVLQRHGIDRAMVNGGGDVLLASGPLHRPWRIGIRHPRRPRALLCQVDVRHGFVVSSGDYERFYRRGNHRYHHILDPRTGYSVDGLAQVTLMGDTLETVDGYSAALLVLGPERAWTLLERLGIPGLLVETSGRIQASSQFAHCRN